MGGKRAIRFTIYGALIVLSSLVLLSCAERDSSKRCPCESAGSAASTREASAQVPAAKATRTIPANPIAWKALPSAHKELTTLAFGSCSSQFAAQPIYQSISTLKPDIFLHLGDVIYADKLGPGGKIPEDVDVVVKARVDYALLASEKDFRAFAERTPFLGVWDDHDYGKNDAGKEFPRKEEMKDLYLEFFAAPSSDERRSRPGLYTSKLFGPVGRRTQIIFLDTRSFRSPWQLDTRDPAHIKQAKMSGHYQPSRDPAASMLGDTQWAWFEEQLKVPAELRVVASSVQVIASNRGEESWANFPLEQERFVRLVTKAAGVIVLSGDVHFAELSLSNAGAYPLYELTSSNLSARDTDWGERFNRDRRIEGPVSAKNFGSVSVDWNASPPSVRLSAHSLDGTVAFFRDISLVDLTPPARGVTP